MNELIQVHLLAESPAKARLLKVNVGKKEFATPTYFPAISRKEIGDPDDKFVELVTSAGYPRLLISAYDYGRLETANQRRVIGHLSEYYRRGPIVMLDSGVFEAYWREDSHWTFRRYRTSVKNVDSDFFFSFDVLPVENEKIDSRRKLTMKSISNSIELTDRSQCIPIVHAKNSAELGKTVAYLVREIPGRINSLAVSERELGQTLSKRGNTIMRLRRILDNQDGGLLHILGCGNPTAMAIYAYCGADTFDSLDWASRACDPIQDEVIDISLFELLDCKCKACRDSRFDSSTRVFLHNLLFYQNYSLKLQTMVKQQTLKDYLQETTSKKFISRLGLER